MFKLLYSVVLGLIALQQSQCLENGGKNWVFLAATSNGWMNYRHQADLCHSYQLLRENGIPAENIITMFYDDIANNAKNKDKGVIINKPGGHDVYKGVAKDYTAEDVNVKNFLNVLSGNKEAMKGIGTGRVIESGPNDHIFVYIVDHGDTGMLLFPNDEYMYAHNLTQQLRQMRKENRFKKMLMYIEACKAGSMFDNIIDDDLQVFVSTASATDEFSWARYCDTIDTCLGDFYSTTWMEHMDQIRENWSAKYTSVFKQFKYTRTNVVKSHVNIYGDFRLGFDKVSAFIGDDWVANKSNEFQQLYYSHSNDDSVVSTEHLPIYLLESKIRKSQDLQTKIFLQAQLESMKKKRSIIDETMKSIVHETYKADQNKLVKSLNDTNPAIREHHFPCYQNVINQLNKNCINTYKNSYITRHFYKLANLCILGYNQEDFLAALEKTCGHIHKTMRHSL